MKNAGALDIDGVDVTMRQNSSEGKFLGILSVTDKILPGAYRDISWKYRLLPMKARKIVVSAIADEDDVIDEFYEDNNVRSVKVMDMTRFSPYQFGQ